MKFESGVIVDFEPKFRNLDQDRERYMFAMVDLREAGAFEVPEGETLFSMCDPGLDRIDEQYFERGLHDLIEKHYTPTGETFYGTVYPGAQRVAELFIALGEPARARRLWRSHIALMKRDWWWYVDERRRGFKPMDLLFPSEREQRRDWEEMIGRIPEKKRIILEVLSDFRALLMRVGASEAELARVDRDIADIEAEERRPPGGKPDPRALDEDLFWEIIGANGAAGLSERLEALPDVLARFKPKTIRDFEAMAREKWGAAYRTDVWALAYLLRGGCSDDSFMGFRGWLIMAGREIHESVLADPDGFDVAHWPGDSDGCESLLEAAAIAYEMRAGKTMRPKKAPPLELTGPAWEEHEFAARLPRIAAAVGWEG